MSRVFTFLVVEQRVLLRFVDEQYGEESLTIFFAQSQRWS